MLELYQNIKKYRIEKKMTQDELAKKAGYTDRSSIAKIERGDVDLPQSKIHLIANALGVSAGALMGNTGVCMPSFPNIHPIAKKAFPLFDGIACGEPRLMPDGIELYVDAAADIKADYVLIAHGDSMIGARIHDKDYVFIRQQSDVENGEIAAVAIGEEATLKRVYWYASRQLLVLRAENPDYSDIEISGADLEKVHILGKAVAFQSDLK